MSAFHSTAEIQQLAGGAWGQNADEHDDVSSEEESAEERSFGDHFSYSGSSGSEGPRAPPAQVGLFEGMFGSTSTKTSAEGGDGGISQYWQNYDLNVSLAPKLFSDAEFEAVKRIEAGLKVLVLRIRLKERIASRKREREVRAAVRVQAVVRGIAVRMSLPALREHHSIRARVKKQYKLFKRELRNDGFPVQLYHTKDGALRKVLLKPDGKLTSLCWSGGVAIVKSGSVPLIALKSCYTGYPKQDFPTKSMLARGTPLPDRSKTFTIQVDTGRAYVFVTDDNIHKKLLSMIIKGPDKMWYDAQRAVRWNSRMVKGLQSIIAEISSPDSFYFDGMGVLRRVTSSIFDDRGNIAQREAMKRQRHARFRFRQAEAGVRLAILRPKGPVSEGTAEPGQPRSPSRTMTPRQKLCFREPNEAGGDASQTGSGSSDKNQVNGHPLTTERQQRPPPLKVTEGGG